MMALDRSKAGGTARFPKGLLQAAIFLGLLVSARSQSSLPEGNGKEIIEKHCVQCHELRRITGAGHSREDWKNVLDMMITLGTPVPKDQVPALIDYLAKNFPDRSPKGVVVAGSAEASIQEWTVPTPGSRPHDPLVAPDGSIWYSGQMANVLGRFDPATGQFKEYHLKTAKSGPHGLVADKDGNIWYTANFASYIGKLDPKTGEVTEYKMPDPKAKDPHTPIFDKNGTLWFTLQGANMVGRVIPKTGEVKVVPVPTPRANPYGMVVNSKGVVFFCEFGSNKLAKIDAQTMEIHEYVLPNPDARPRRIAITPDDVLWYSDYARGYLGRLDPQTGKTTEWPSPGGPKSQPYGIATVGNIVWYSESGTRPNTVVRFDTRTEKFQSWIIASGGGVVRNMMAAPDGNLWLACSGVNGIAKVEVKSPGTTAITR
jgi:virginiamycin B lyase